MSKTIETLRRCRENSSWCYNNIDKLKQRYVEQWVAIDRGKVVASSKNFEDLIEKLQELPEKVRTVAFIEFIYKNEPYLILQTT